MKKLLSIIGTFALTVVLSTNVFAFSVFPDLLTTVVGQVVTAVINSVNGEDCLVKTCQTCKPDQPNCRPLPN